MDIPEQLMPAVGHGESDGRASDGRRGRHARRASMFFSADSRRRIRLEQWFVSAVAYVATFLVLWLGLRLGWMDASRLVPWGAAITGGQVLIYAALRSGWSERFSDPALTIPQVLLALVGVEWGYLITGAVRSVALFPLLLIFTFGAFSLGWRRIAGLTVLTLLSLLGTIVFLHMDSAAADAWSLRNPDFRLDVINFLMISIMLPALAWLAARLSSLRTRLRSQRAALTEALREVQRLATHDALTGLCNRRYMEQRLAEEQSRCERQAPPFSVALIDLDYFKRINDAHGHAGGDCVLQAFAVEMQRDMRTCDLIARWGGEEFLLLMPGTDAIQALDCIERLLHSVLAMPQGDAGSPLSFSAGVTEYRNGETIAHTVARADQAMYAAKNAGRSRVLLA